MSLDIVIVGEALVEVMRKGIDQPLYQAGEFLGPYPSGASAIFADAAAKLGGSVGFIGAIGSDDFGRCIRDRLEKDGMDASQVQPEYFAGVRFLHVMGFALSINESCRQACYKAVDLVKKGGGKVSLDPNLRPEVLTIEEIREVCRPVLEVAEIVLPSGEEAMMLAGVEDTGEAVRELLRQGPRIVALKQGEKGSTVFTAEEKIEAPPFRITEVDPTGAGDCYDAAFVIGLLEGWDLGRTARFANAVGALATTRQGPMEGTFTREEVMAFMAEQGVRQG
jgi:sugar/nucleoside kinase (ribokinase family)